MQRSPRGFPTARRGPDAARKVKNRGPAAVTLDCMQFNQVRWRLAIAGILGAEASLIAMAFGWVAIYSYFVNPGQQFAVYDRFAQATVPYIGLLLSVPVFFFTCRWIGLRAPSSAGGTTLAVFGLYCLIDIPLTLTSSSPIVTPWFMAIDLSLKLLTCLGGAMTARKPA